MDISSVEVNIQGAIETGQFKATFIDYDGEIITIKRKDFGSILTLPEPPQNDRFSFVEWRCSETITDNSIVMPACDIVVGALRTPANGYSQIDIELTPATGLLFKGFSVRSDEPYTKTRIYLTVPVNGVSIQIVPESPTHTLLMESILSRYNKPHAPIM